jgi:Ca-activated chloride channel family protein
MSIAASFTPLVAATGKAVNLSMQRLWLTGQVLPAGARLVVQHIFRSEENQPLEVVYCFPLPRDAALRSFRIAGERFEAHSELKETEAAVKAYEEGIAQGSLATLARAYGDGVVNLTVGNIRPKETVTVHLEILCGVELRDDGFRFRFPFTLAPGYHSRMKAAVTATGEGEVELPAGEFGDMILPPFREDASALHQAGFELTISSQLELDEVGSPSHAVRVKQEGGRAVRVALATEKDVPNRDLVLDARFRSIEPQVLSGRDKSGKGHFAAIVPSSSFGGLTQSARRVVILLDRSGSMGGAPIEQARKAIAACLALLSEADSFGLVAFDNEALAFRPALVPGTRELRDQAQEFLLHVDARGGTELALGFQQAAKLLDGNGGDILILTDGQVSGTETILAQARSAGVRLHCLGIGSASQDRFLALLARETGGVSRFLTARERVDLGAVDLFASIGRPVASELKAGANVQPEPPSFVFSGTPVLLFGEGGGSGGEQIQLTWHGGELNLPVAFNQDDIAETVCLLQGSRLIADWESRYPGAEASASPDKRKQNRIAMRLLTLSQTYGLASREMSLVAVVTRPGDRPGELPETRTVPVGMAQDVNFGAYFPGQAGAGRLRAPGAPPAASAPRPRMASTVFAMTSLQDMPMFSRAPKEPPLQNELAAPPADQDYLAKANPDILFNLASRMDSDGGLAGTNLESRTLATVIALLAFLSQGHTLTDGAFRSHVARLVSFLKSLKGISGHRQEVVAAVLEFAKKSAAPSGEWIALARNSGNRWEDVESLLKA